MHNALVFLGGMVAMLGGLMALGRAASTTGSNSKMRMKETVRVVVTSPGV